MKKSIIAIAFLLLCPFYGVRAQERPFFDLSGKGWHLWQDKNAAWQTEDIYLTLEEARKSPVIVPTAGWDILTSAQTLSVQVPGTAEEYLPSHLIKNRIPMKEERNIIIIIMILSIQIIRISNLHLLSRSLYFLILLLQNHQSGHFLLIPKAVTTTS